MVEIIKGTFGYFDGRRVVPVTIKDGPQNWDSDLERRLVARGIARYVDEGSPAQEPAEAPAEPEELQVEEPQTEETDFTKMTVKQLKVVAEEMGIDTKPLKKKADLIVAIEDAAPPAFDAGDAIV